MWWMLSSGEAGMFVDVGVRFDSVASREQRGHRSFPGSRDAPHSGIMLRLHACCSPLESRPGLAPATGPTGQLWPTDPELLPSHCAYAHWSLALWIISCLHNSGCEV